MLPDEESDLAYLSPPPSPALSQSSSCNVTPLETSSEHGQTIADI
jgi:hypothetical protein